MSDERRITDELVHELAERADVDRHSVYRRLLGLPVRGRAGRRVDEAIAELGLRREESAACA